MKSVTLGTKRQMVLVTTVKFNEVIEIGDPMSQAKIYEAQSADELICIDLDASTENRLAAVDIIRSTAAQICMPLTAGGGVTTIEDFRTLLSNGADKVSINTAAVENPQLITESSRIFGAQCVVVSIDYKLEADGTRVVMIGGGKKQTKWEAVAWAKEAHRLGAGEILLTSIDRDGTREGLDCELTRQVVDAVSIPVIASGGCGLARHFVEGFIEGKADAVSAGTYFCFLDQNPMQTRSHIMNASIPIRIHRGAFA